jgi:hypothetical protein
LWSVEWLEVVEVWWFRQLLLLEVVLLFRIGSWAGRGCGAAAAAAAEDAAGVEEAAAAAVGAAAPAEIPGSLLPSRSVSSEPSVWDAASLDTEGTHCFRRLRLKQELKNRDSILEGSAAFGAAAIGKRQWK